MDSTHHDRPAGVAERFQIIEHPVAASASERRAVLSNNPTRSDLVDEPGHLEPEAASFSGKPSATTGGADVLARKSAGDDVGPNNSICCELPGGEGADVGIAEHVRPASGEHGAGIGLAFAECDSSHSATLKPKAEASDAGKEVEHIHAATFRARRSCNCRITQ